MALETNVKRKKQRNAADATEVDLSSRDRRGVVPVPVGQGLAETAVRILLAVHQAVFSFLLPLSCQYLYFCSR